MKISTALTLIVGSYCLEAATGVMASTEPIYLWEGEPEAEGSLYLGEFFNKGSEINNWIVDRAGYSICHIEGGSGLRHRHLGRALHEVPHERAKHVRAKTRVGKPEKTGRAEHVRAKTHVGKPETGARTSTHHADPCAEDYDFEYFYCKDHGDGTIGPNLHYPVYCTDPNLVSDHILPPNIHTSFEEAVNQCGSFCQEALTRGRDLRRKLTAPSTGTVPNLVIPFIFGDQGSRRPDLPSQNALHIMFNSNSPSSDYCPTGSVKKLFLDNSLGEFHLESTVVEWVQLDSQYTEAYCTGVLNGGKHGNGPEFEECLVNALEKVDGSVDFGSFDTNGDGYIDAITFIHSSYCAATTGADDNVWSHQSHLMGEFTSQEGAKVSPYHINPAWKGHQGNKMSPIHVISHEMVHFLGVPDLYDRNSGGTGIGAWSLLAYVYGFTNDGLYPPLMDPWSRLKVGWGTSIEISSTQTGVVLEPSYSSGKYYKITKNFPSGEYLYIENRQRMGFDAKIPSEGILIWHIDENKQNNNDEGHPGQSGWPENNRHYMVALLQADGSYHFENGRDWQGDATDVYGNGFHYLGASTDKWPNTASYQNGQITVTGVVISNIKSAGGDNMQFDINFCCASDDCWRDIDGDGCERYADNLSWCSVAANYAVDGVDASTECCACVESSIISNSVGCSNNNDGWVDLTGHGCGVYANKVGWCSIAANYAVDGVDASSKCCACMDDGW